MSGPLSQPHGISPGQGYTPDQRSGSYQGNEGQDSMLTGAQGSTHAMLKGGPLQSFAGTIIQVAPHARSYTVRVGGEGNIQCRHGLNNPADVACLVNGAYVLVNMSPGNPYGVIYGFIPDGQGGGDAAALPDTVLIGGGALGLPSDMYDIYKNQDMAGGIGAVNDRTPTDNLPGDAGLISAAGVGLHVGLTSAVLRGTDICSIEVHALDSLLRTYGHNYEHFTAGSELRVFDDEGELHHVEYHAKFREEALGYLPGSEGSIKPFIDKPQTDWASDKGRFEPVNPNQAGVWRDMTARGYLGDIERKVVYRQSDKYKDTLHVYGDEDDPVALSDIHRLSTGAIHIRSAKEIILEKYVLLPAPVQLRMPDDGEGDWSENYMAAGALGEGDDPPEQKEYDVVEEHFNRRMGVLDEYLTYVRNWYGNLNFVAHKKDWRVTEESGKSDGWELKRSFNERMNIEGMKTSYWGGVAKVHKIDIDTRLKGVKYFESWSKVVLMDDGCILMEDGWGTQFSMIGGNVVISPPGDIVLNPGRRVVANCGWDFIARAKGSMDFTTTKGDIRMRADKNFHVLAGNNRDDQTGGILLESKAEVDLQDFSKIGEDAISSGIVFMSRKAPIIGFGTDIYFGTSGEGINTNDPGIILDANRDNRPVLMRGREVVQEGERLIGAYTRNGEKIDKYYYSSPEIWFNDSQMLVVDGAISSIGKGAGLFTEGNALVNKALITRKQLIAYGQVVCGTGMIARGTFTHIGADEKGSEMVGKVTEDPFDDIVNTVDTAFSDYESAMKEMKSFIKDLVDAITDYLEWEDSPAGDKLIKEMSFTLRTKEQYNVGNYTFYAAAWQRRLISGGGGQKWEEKPVKATVGDETYPFPGTEHYKEGDSFKVIKEVLFEYDKGVAAARGADGGDYKDAKAQEGESGTLNDWVVMASDKE